MSGREKNWNEKMSKRLKTREKKRKEGTFFLKSDEKNKCTKS